jgi:hypothetical protein
LEISLPQTTAELKSFVSQLDKVILGKAMEWARQSYKTIMEAVDEAIAQNRSEQLSIEHCRTVWYQTRLGSVKVKRRQYRDEEGKYRYLLDELSGTQRYQHTTASVQELALEMASFMPYRRSAEVLRKASAIDLPHQTIWRLVGRAADPYLEKAERELKWFLETGEIPEEESKTVSRLFMEADGVMLSLQRERQRKAEVKLGIAYEGWQKVGKDRFRTVNKIAYAAVADEQAFWSGMVLKLQTKYDLSCVQETIVGGDGASWVKEGADYVNGRFQLDRYHLNRELTMALGNDTETRGRVWHALKCGNLEAGLQIMADAKKKTRGKKAELIAQAYRYLQQNIAGLIDYRLSLGDEGKGLRRTGAMEGNVDKLVARRMKNQGMSWTIKGIRRLLCIRFLVLENKLTGWLNKAETAKCQTKIPKKEMRIIVSNLSMEQPDDWLQANIPALHGPHTSRPWVRALKSISEESHL